MQNTAGRAERAGAATLAIRIAEALVRARRAVDAKPLLDGALALAADAGDLAAEANAVALLGDVERALGAG